MRFACPTNRRQSRFCVPRYGHVSNIGLVDRLLSLTSRLNMGVAINEECGESCMRIITSPSFPIPPTFGAFGKSQTFIEFTTHSSEY